MGLPRRLDSERVGRKLSKRECGKIVRVMVVDKKLLSKSFREKKDCLYTMFCVVLALMKDMVASR